MLYHSKNPHGGESYEEGIVLDYSANTNPFGTPHGVLEAVQGALTELHHYPDPYCRELVQAIAGFEHVPQAYIFCGNGAAELIYAYCEAVEAKSAVILAPTFSEYAHALARMGCHIDRYTLYQEKCFDPDEGFLSFLMACKPDVVFLCNPNNPTGRLIPSCILKDLLGFCHQHGIRLFLDECFLDLSDEGIGMKGYLNAHPELFILKAFTKSYGMAGLRLGYGLCSDDVLLAKMSESVQPWNVSLPAQAAGVAALREQQFLADTKAMIAVERLWLKNELERLGFWVCPSQANYLLFHGRPGLHTALKNYGIAIRSCDNYHGLDPGWYRIAVRLHQQNEQLIKAVRQVLREEQTWQKTL